jgi:hypothetical protein
MFTMMYDIRMGHTLGLLGLRRLKCCNDGLLKR